MKEKIVGILLMMLLIATSMSMVVTTPAYKINSESTDDTCVSINKSVECPDEDGWFKEIDVFVGTTICFWIEIYNCGDFDLDEVKVVDDLPYGLDYVPGSASPIEPEVNGNKLTWSFGPPLQPDEAIFIRFNAYVAYEGEYINEASVTAESNGGDLYNESNAIVHGVLPPSVNIEKWVWDPEADNGKGDWVDEKSVEFGGEARFKIRIYNDGEATITNLVVNDTLPEGLEYAGNANPISPIIHGNRLTWEYPFLMKWHIKEMEFDVTGIKEGEYINTAEITADRYGNGVYDSDSATVNVGAKPKSRIECEGTLSWTDVKPGSELKGTFKVKNAGEANSLLDWEVCSYPGSWGTWTFNPSSGEDLKLEDTSTVVTVTVIAPDEKNAEYSDQIRICNKEDAADFYDIDVSLATSKNKAISFHSLFLEFLQNHPHLFPLLRFLLNLPAFQ